VDHPLSAEDLEIQAKARDFVDELIPYEVEAELSGGRLPDDVLDRGVKLIGELGFEAINMPKELGGGGFTSLQQVLVQEQVGRATNALAWLIHTPASWLPQVATPYQMEQWVLPTIRREKRECYAITEEAAGSDVDAIQAIARRDGDDYVLSGEKWHVTSFNHSEYVFFQAKLADGPHAGEHAMFVMDVDTPGIRVVRTPEYTHTIDHDHAILAFEDVRVPATHLVGSEGDGMHFAYEWFRYERLMIAARCCGAMDRLITEATAFAKDRLIRGQPLMDYQAIQFMLSDSLTELWASRLMTYRTAREIDDGVDVKIQHAHCSMAKLFVSEAAGRVADRCVQIFGGRGYMRENVAERFFRELRVERIWEGTSEIQRIIIAGQLAKRGVRALTG
jgi:alkylation response protein AidB-like acyl-CoA dehydrogenase